MSADTELEALRARAEKAEAELRALEDVLDQEARRMHRVAEREAALAAGAAEREAALGAGVAELLAQEAPSPARGRALALVLGALLGGVGVAGLVLPRWADERAAAVEASASYAAERARLEADLDAARADARHARAAAAPARVPAELRIVRAARAPGAIDAALAAVPALRLAPFDELSSLTELSHESASLTLGVPLELPLPDGRELCIVVDGTTDTGRYRVRVLVNRHAGGAYDPVRSVLAAPDAPFFFHDAEGDGELVVVIVLGATPDLGPLLSAPVEPPPATAFLRGELEALAQIAEREPAGAARDAAVLARARALVDLDAIAGAITGEGWAAATSAERSEITALLWEHTALGELADLGGSDLAYAAEERAGDDTRVVVLATPRAAPRAEPIELGCVLRETGGALRLVDLERDERSVVRTLRLEVRDALAAGGRETEVAVLRRLLTPPRE